MIKGIALITACAALGTTRAAQAVVVQTTDAQPWQTWANAAQVPTYAGVVPVSAAGPDAACGDDAGCTAIFPQVDHTTGAILPGPPASVSVQIATGDPADMERGYLYHELGHVFDAEYMNTTTRAQFMAIVGLPGGSARWWYSRTLVEDGVTIAYEPGEWFAEGYRMCATWGINQPSVNTFEDYGYPGDRPSFAARQRAVCGLIDQVGRDNGIATPQQAAYPTPRAKPARTRRLSINWGRRRIW